MGVLSFDDEPDDGDDIRALIVGEIVTAAVEKEEDELTGGVDKTSTLFVTGVVRVDDDASVAVVDWFLMTTISHTHTLNSQYG